MISLFVECKVKPDLSMFQNIKPQPLVTQVIVQMHVKNLNNAHRIQGVLRNVSSSVILHSGEISLLPISHFFSFTKLTWDDEKKKDGIATARFPIVNLLESSRAKPINEVVIKIDPYLGASPPIMRFDVSQDITDEGDKLIKIDLGKTEGLDPYDNDVSIGDWEDENIDIK